MRTASRIHTGEVPDIVETGTRRNTRGRPLPLLIAFVLLVSYSLTACSPPDDSTPADIIGNTDCVDTWRNDTVRVRTTIRFEAIVDSTKTTIDRFAGSGLRLSLVCVPPDTSSLPYFDMYSISANYLDIPATGLPFEAVIPPQYFQHYDCARMAAAIIIIYRDSNGNERFDRGEEIFGADEQSIYAFAQGELSTIPSNPFESVSHESNVLIRYDLNVPPRFQASPDYLATIFIISVRGSGERYNIPYPWQVSVPLTP